MKVQVMSLGPRSNKFGSFGVDFWRAHVKKNTYYLRVWGFGKGCMIGFTYG